MKKIIILVVLLFLTGCADVNYDLIIDKNLNIREEVNISATKEYFNNFYRDLPITIVKNAYENDDLVKPLRNNNYYYELKRDNKPYPSVFASKKYNNLKEYENNTIFVTKKFEKMNITETNNLVTIQTSGYYTYAPDDSSGELDDRFDVATLDINIKTPFVVTNHNADSFDKKTNTYIWNIKEDTKDKEIKLTFDKDKIYVYNLDIYLSYLVVLIIVLIIVFIVIHFIRKGKKNNRIIE